MSYDISATWATVLVLAALWEFGWKGLALWMAGRRNQPVWFVALLLINSIGILPIIYLLASRNTSALTKHG
jgi:hypothetical protein